MNYQERQLFDRLARDIWRDIEPGITAATKEMEAQIEKLRETWRSTPAIVSPPNPPPAPASPAPVPEPTLAQRLEEMEPQAFFAAMQADPRAMLAKIAQADAEA